MKTIKEKFTTNAEEFDSMLGELLAENEKLKQELAELKLLKSSSHVFYRGQQILFGKNDIEMYETGLLIGITKNKSYQFRIKTDKGLFDSVYCKPDPNAVTRPVWVEHNGGGCTVASNDLVAIEFSSGVSSGGLAKNINWNGVTRYCIIPRREVL